MRKRKLLVLSLVFSLLLITSAFAQEPVYKVLNPRGMRPEIKQYSLASRVADLNNKVVYVISQHVLGADIFLKKVSNALPKYIPGVKAIYVDKPAPYMFDEPDLWLEVNKNASAFIYGCAA